MAEAGLEVPEQGLTQTWRPDEADLEKAAAFGKAFGERVLA